MDLRRFRIFLLMTMLGPVSVLLSCVSTTEDEGYPDTNDVEVAVSFAPNIGATKDTRATLPDTKGELTTERLKETTGFGVFTYYSEDKEYPLKGDNTDKPFNFMFNQQVNWDTDHWTYSPLKYWPNDNQPADNKGATGSVDHSYLSFFAYAPYTPYRETTTETNTTDAAADSDDGIVKITSNDTETGQSYLTYRMSAERPFEVDNNVDLLWAMRPNLWKTMDEKEQNEDGSETVTHPGYVNGQVKFNFKHALAKFTICVQGLFDRTSTADQSKDYPDDVDPNTRILVESVDFSGSPLMTQGNMYLVPHTSTSTSDDDSNGKTLNAYPYWELRKLDGEDAKPTPLLIKDFDINGDIRDAYYDPSEKHYDRDYFHKGATADADSTEAMFKELPKGVTHKEVSLFNDEDHYCLVIPNKDYIEGNSDEAMTVRIVYHVITYDPNLKFNSTPYCSIVRNAITATFSDDFVFEPNKKYKLRLLLGLTTVKFELLMADGWETPLLKDPVVIDWYIERKEFNVE